MPGGGEYVQVGCGTEHGLRRTGCWLFGCGCASSDTHAVCLAPHVRAFSRGLRRGSCDLPGEVVSLDCGYGCSRESSQQQHTNNNNNNDDIFPCLRYVGLLGRTSNRLGLGWLFPLPGLFGVSPQFNVHQCESPLSKIVLQDPSFA